MSNREESAGPYLALIGVQAFFGSLPVIAKVVLKVVPAFGLVGLRVGITALVLVIFQAARGRLFSGKPGGVELLSRFTLHITNRKFAGA